MNTKREVWEAAKDCGLNDFISAASRAFDGDIAGIKITTPEGEDKIWMRGRENADAENSRG